MMLAGYPAYTGRRRCAKCQKRGNKYCVSAKLSGGKCTNCGSDSCSHAPDAWTQHNFLHPLREVRAILEEDPQTFKAALEDRDRMKEFLETSK